MYDIYLNYFYSTTGSGSTVTTERLVCSIPYDPNDATKRVFMEPKVKGEMGKAGSFEFYVTIDNPYYDCWKQMVTTVRVEYRGDTIFFGRVLTIDNDHLTGKRSIHCEGALAFLIDSQQEGVKDDDRPEISGSTYIQNLITSHNTQMSTSVPGKQFTRGYVPGNYSSSPLNACQRITINGTKRFGSSSWQDTASAFSDLVNNYGGYLRVRYENNQMYLDWIDCYFREYGSDVVIAPGEGRILANRIIEVGENVISLSSTSEVDNIFTYVIPIGSKDGNPIYVRGYTPSGGSAQTSRYLRVPDIVNVYSSSDLNKGYHSVDNYANAVSDYGRIYKTVKFDNADTQEKLWQYAWDWIKNNYNGGISSFTASAIDLGLIFANSPRILVGDQVKIRYPNANGTISEKLMTVTSIEYDLMNPENTSYTIGTPNPQVDTEYGNKAKKKSGSNQNAAAAGGGGGPSAEEVDEKVEHHFWNHIIDNAHNVEDYQEYKQKYGDEAAASIQQSAVFYLNAAFDHDGADTNWWKSRIKQMVLDAHAGKLTFYQDPAIINSAVTVVNEEQIKDVQAATQAVVVDAFNGALTIKEKLDLVSPSAVDLISGRVTPRNGLDLFATGQGGVLKGYQINPNNHSESAKTSALLDSGSSLISSVKALYADSCGAAIDAVQNGTSLGKVGIDAATSQVYCTSDNQNKTVQAKGDGTNGEGALNVGVSSGSNTWNIELNKAVTYLDEDGNTVTATKFVSAGDFQIKGDTDSIKTKLLVVEDLIADRATIGQLLSVEGDIETLSSRMITTDNLAASIGNIETLQTQILASTLFSANTIWSPAIQKNAASPSVWDGVYTIEAQNVGNGSTKLRMQDYNGNWTDIVTFNSAVSYISGTWNGTTFTAAIDQNASSATASTTVILGVEYDIASLNNTIYARLYHDSINPLNVLDVITMTLTENVSAKTVTLSTPAEAKGRISTVATYNAGWDYGLSTGVLTAAAASSSEIAIKTLDYGQSWKITHTFDKSDGTNQVTNYIVKSKPDRYNDGYDAARGYAVLPEAGGTGTTFVVKFPNSARTGSEDKTFTISKGTPSSSGGYVSVTRPDSQVVGRIDISNWWNSGWNDGYDTAMGYAILPAAGGTGTTFVVKFPNSARTGSDDKTFTINKGTPSADGGYVSVTRPDSQVVGRIDISDWWDEGYSSGYDSAKLSTLVWTNNSCTISKTNSGADSRTFSVAASNDITYNSSTHKYTGKCYASVSGTARHERSYDSGTQAFQDGGVVASFSVSTPSGEATGSYTNNSDGYYISGSGSGATIAIVVRGAIVTAGVSGAQTKKSSVTSAAKKVYLKGMADADALYTQVRDGNSNTNFVAYYFNSTYGRYESLGSHKWFYK